MNSHLKYFENLFELADKEQRGQIRGKLAVAFFKKSGVPLAKLREIWTLSTPNREDALNKERFFTALKLISQAQCSRPLSVSAQLDKLPHFEGIPLPEVEVDQNLSQKFREEFRSLNSLRLDAQKAREILVKKGITVPQLKKIWTLVDPLRTGILTENQFVAALHIIHIVKHKKSEVPKELPGAIKGLINTEPEETDPLKVIQSMIQKDMIELSKFSDTNLILQKTLTEVEAKQKEMEQIIKRMETIDFQELVERIEVLTREVSQYTREIESARRERSIAASDNEKLKNQIEDLQQKHKIEVESLQIQINSCKLNTEINGNRTNVPSSGNGFFQSENVGRNENSFQPSTNPFDNFSFATSSHDTPQLANDKTGAQGFGFDFNASNIFNSANKSAFTIQESIFKPF